MQTRDKSGSWHTVLQIVVHASALSLQDVLRLACVNHEFHQLRSSLLQPLRSIEIHAHTCRSVLDMAPTRQQPGVCLFPEAEELVFVDMENSLFYECMRQLTRLIVPVKLRRLSLVGTWPAPLQTVPSIEDDRTACVLRSDTCANLESIQVQLEHPYNDQLSSWFTTSISNPPQLKKLIWVMGVRRDRKSTRLNFSH